MSSGDALHLLLHHSALGGFSTARYVAMSNEGKLRSELFLPTRGIEDGALFNDVVVANIGDRHIGIRAGEPVVLWDQALAALVADKGCQPQLSGGYAATDEKTFVRTFRCDGNKSLIGWFDVHSGALTARVAVGVAVDAMVANEEGAVFVSGRDFEGRSRVIAFNPDSSVRWTANRPHESAVRATWEGVLYLDDGHVLDTVSGRAHAKFDLAHRAREVLVTDERVTFLGTIGAPLVVTSFDLDGRRLWTAEIADYWVSPNAAVTNDGRIVLMQNRYSITWDYRSLWAGTDLIELDKDGARSGCALPSEAYRLFLLGNSLTTTHLTYYNMGVGHSYDAFELPPGLRAATAGWVNTRGNAAGTARPAVAREP